MNWKIRLTMKIAQLIPLIFISTLIKIVESSNIQTNPFWVSFVIFCVSLLDMCFYDFHIFLNQSKHAQLHFTQIMTTCTNVMKKTSRVTQQISWLIFKFKSLVVAKLSDKFRFVSFLFSIFGSLKFQCCFYWHHPAYPTVTIVIYTCTLKCT